MPKPGPFRASKTNGVTIIRLAAEAGCGETHVSRLIKQGCLSAIPDGRRLLVPNVEAKRFVKEWRASQPNRGI
jgi:hypothetical protein